MDMNHDNYQKTIAAPVTCAGIGVHSGKQVNLTIRPAPANHGIKFVRTDLPNSPCVPARFNKVVDTSQATVIGSDGFIISTPEHLMAALAGLGIDNALVEVDAYELPIMDGSAGPYVRAINSTGMVIQESPRCFFRITTPIELTDGGKFVGIYPAPHFRISCTIDFDHPLIGTQAISIIISPNSFAEEIADARTFGFMHEVEYMKKFDLAKGASLDNTVVIDGDRVLNPGGLRFPDEFVRHKMLDCIGDFSLLGLPLMGHVITKKSGHNFNHAFLQKFFTRKDAWQTYVPAEASAWENAAPKRMAH
jgi:UDP-3-O-[3-hydroxymyristoyl] N-acetylglucosamine deacetylase